MGNTRNTKGTGSQWGGGKHSRKPRKKVWQGPRQRTQWTRGEAKQWRRDRGDEVHLVEKWKEKRLGQEQVQRDEIRNKKKNK